MLSDPPSTICRCFADPFYLAEYGPVSAVMAAEAEGDSEAAKSIGVEDCGVWAREHGYPGFCVQVALAPLAVLMYAC